MKPPVQNESINEDRVSLLIVVGWLLLVGGRWVVTPIIMFGDPILAARMVNVDRGVLLICYLILACATLVVIALRLSRSIQHPVDSSGQRTVEE